MEHRRIAACLALILALLTLPSGLNSAKPTLYRTNNFNDAKSVVSNVLESIDATYFPIGIEVVQDESDTFNCIANIDSQCETNMIHVSCHLQ